MLATLLPERFEHSVCKTYRFVIDGPIKLLGDQENQLGMGSRNFKCKSWTLVFSLACAGKSRGALIPNEVHTVDRSTTAQEPDPLVQNKNMYKFFVC